MGLIAIGELSMLGGNIQFYSLDKELLFRWHWFLKLEPKTLQNKKRDSNVSLIVLVCYVDK